MSDKSMIKYKENFISKIRGFFKKLFRINKEQDDCKSEILNLNDEVQNCDEKENEFFDNIKVDSSNINKVIEKNNFLEYIDGNIELLKRLSVDRLRKLKKYYDGVIEENDKIIEELKKSE